MSMSVYGVSSSGMQLPSFFPSRGLKYLVPSQIGSQTVCCLYLPSLAFLPLAKGRTPFFCLPLCPHLLFSSSLLFHIFMTLSSLFSLFQK